MYVENIHENGHLYAAVFEIFRFFRFFNDYDFAVGRSQYSVVVQGNLTVRKPEEIDDQKIENHGYNQDGIRGCRSVYEIKRNAIQCDNSRQ